MEAREFQLHLLQACCTQAASKAELEMIGQTLTVDEYYNLHAQAAIRTFKAFFYGHPNGGRVKAETQWPADWWQAFKDRWFPAWALKLWPVEYEYFIVDEPCYNVCPHMEAPPDYDRAKHVQFLVSEECAF